MSRARAVALAALLIVSIFAGVVPLSQQATAQQGTTGPPSFVDVPSQNTQKSPEVVDPGNPPKHALSSTSPQQGGPPAYVEELLQKVPAKALSNTRVSKHANTTMVVYAATEEGKLAVVVTDEVSSDGRTVAIGANVLYRTLDKAPKLATVRHESGESETTRINYSDGYAHIPIEGFSTNTVTFSGQVHLTGDPAVDGTSYQYGLQDLDAVGSYSINVTGDTAYERENQSGQVGDGETIPLSIAGTADPVGPEGQAVPQVVLEGTETTSLFSTSGGPVTSGDSATFSLGGNQDPRNAEITFEGDRSETARTVSGTAVSDGYTNSYTVNGNLPAEGESVTFTGVETTGTQTTASGTDGGLVNPSGNMPPIGPSANGEPQITFVGKESTTTDNYAANGVSLTYTESINVGGNLPPTDGTGGNPTLSVTAHTPSASTNPVSDQGDGTTDVNYAAVGDDNGDNLRHIEMQVHPSETIDATELEVNIANTYGSDYGVVADVYITQGTPDASVGDGQKVGTWDPDWALGTQTITLDSTYTLNANTDYTVELVTPSTDNDGSTDHVEIAADDSASSTWIYQSRGTQNYDQQAYADLTVIQNTSADGVSVTDGAGHSHTFGDFTDGETKTTSLDLSTSSTELNFDGSGGGTIDYDLTMEERTGTEDPRVDVTGDSTADASASGVLASGQTTTVELAELDETSQTVDTWAATAGPAPDWDITYTPRWTTENPALDIDADGTNEASYTGEIQPGNTQTISVDGLQSGTSYTASTSLASSDMAVDWDLDFTEVTAVENPGVDIDQDGVDDATYSGTLDAGEGSTEPIADGLLTTGSNTIDFSQDGGPAYNYTLDVTEVYHTEDPDIDVDGDGTYEVTYTGILSPGSTATYDASELTLQSDQLAIVTNGGSEVIAEAQYRERTLTQDVTVSVNGNPTSYDLTLDDGETQSLAVNESWLVNGTNTVEISVASSTGSDAPDGQVGLDYYHTAEDHVETTYQGETWTERYNVSKTWANPKENATLTIPFDSDKVVGIRDVERSVNDSEPTAVDPANFSLEGTTLTVEFGDVQEGETIAVQANGTKVNVGNGDITVTDPTIEGNELDTSFRIDRHDPGFYMELSGTDTPDRVHHLETLSWTGADPYTEHNADGTQFLYLPNATDGGEATMQTLPLDVDPKTGDVHIALEDDNASHPIFDVEPGDQLGDEVEFVWHNTTSGETYVLDSLTNDIARDTQQAESPVTLLDDDSPEVLEIYEEEETATDDGGSSSGGTQYISPVESTRAWYESLPIILIGAALALAVVAAIANYLFREWYKILGTVGAAALVELVLLTEYIWPEVILSPLATGIREIAPTIAFILAVTIAYVIYRRWGTITDSGDEDAVTVSDDGVLRLRRK